VWFHFGGCIECIAGPYSDLEYCPIVCIYVHMCAHLRRTMHIIGEMVALMARMIKRRAIKFGSS
jgi:hypothetical protein